jgi:TonB-dependent starch-binding outer membrane protein SusC
MKDQILLKNLKTPGDSWKQLFSVFSKILLVMILFIQPAIAQQTITGTVSDALNGETLVGATVRIKGTTAGTVTDIDGRYSIDASTDAVLVVSYVGYLEEEVSADGRNIVNILLNPSLQMLSEMVVVGYGSVRKSDLTGAVTTVKSEDLQQLSTINVAQALQGRAAGVHITQSSGAPGAGMQVRIRGITSIANSDPLYIVDGFPAGIGDIVPSDIESIEILKDASAQAIYGSRAAAGVILITTKRGKKGPTQVSFETNIGIQEVWKKMNMPGATDYAIMFMEQYTNDGRTLPHPNYMSRQVYEVLQFAAAGNYKGTNWQDEIYRPALQQNYTMTINGGTEQNRFNISGTYSDQQGIQMNSSLNKVIFRVNTDHVVKSWLNAGTNISFTRGVHMGGVDVSRDALKRNPIAPIYNQDGSWNSPIPDTGPSHPIRRLEHAQYRWPLNHAFAGSGYFEVKPISGLTFRSQFRYGQSNSESRSYNPEFWVTSLESNNRTSVSEGRSQNYGWTWSNYATYAMDFGQHSVNATAGTEAQYYFSHSLGAQSFDQPDISSMWWLGATTAIDSARVNINFPYEETMNSYFMRGNYSYMGKYLMTATVRWDGSSKFARGYKWGMFPSFSLGWNLKEEQFLQNIDILSSLKFRGGWGQVGNSQSVGSFAYLTSIVGNQKYVFGNQVVEGQAVERLGNLEIQWETAEQTNIGIDGSLFRNMLGFNVDYFVRTTRGMLYDLPTPYFAGAAGSPANLASMENRGWDFSLTYRNYENKFKYDISANISTYRNKVLKLNDEGGSQEGGLIWHTGQNATYTTAGDEMAFFYLIPVAGVFQTQDEIDEYAYINFRGQTVPIQPNAKPGDLKFIDVNGDGVINNLDRIKAGSPHPDFHFGFSLNMEYSNFYLSTFLQGVYGNNIVNGNPVYNRINRWTPENPSTNEPRLTQQNLNNNFRLSQYYLEDGSYLRVRNIQLGYNFPARVLQMTGLSKGRIYISLDNMFTFTRYSGPEPEVVNGWYGHPLAPGIDAGVYPQSKIYSLGASISF